MKLSKKNKKLLIDEIALSIKLMKHSEEESLAKVLYFFSSINSIFQRLFNIDYDADMVYAHSILLSVHNSFVSAIQSPIGLISKEHIECLIELSEMLMLRIKDDEDWEDVLKRFVLLSYSLTGNGHYLLNYKKVLKLPFHL